MGSLVSHDDYVQGLTARVASLTDEKNALTRLVDSYRLVTERLIGQADNARREAAGLKPRPVKCPAMSKSGKVCDYDAAHDGWHRHDGDGGMTAWSTP